MKSLSDALKNTRIDAALVVPSVLEEMSKSPELLDFICTNLDTIIYSGGDLPLGCGNKFASRIQLINFYGTTEGASLPLIRPKGELSGEDWKYLNIHPDAGVEFRHYTEDKYELLIVRHQRFEKHQQMFKTFPNLEEYGTRDLFIPHPTKPNRWSHCGRTDDIVFLNGVRIYPSPMEQHIVSSHREISGVIIAGTLRSQTSLLIELKGQKELTPEYKVEMMEQIWPGIEEGNKKCAPHARIAKSHILFISPTCPMVRTPKGTIMRAASLAQYTEQLDLLYANAEKNLEPSHASVDLNFPTSNLAPL